MTAGLPNRRAAADERPVFILSLRPEPGVDATRALRWLLKIALRRFRLRCISVEQERSR
jgi:hypothetical protein